MSSDIFLVDGDICIKGNVSLICKKFNIKKYITNNNTRIKVMFIKIIK